MSFWFVVINIGFLNVCIILRSEDGLGYVIFIGNIFCLNSFKRFISLMYISLVSAGRILLRLKE